MKKQKVLGVIPARLNSTRLPRKLLLDMCGNPIIVWTWQQAKKANKLDDVIVATDSKEIREVVEAAGGNVVMTSSRPQTGSDRVAEAARKFKGFKPDIVINIQGDEPLMPPAAINKTVQLLLDDKKLNMSTVARPFPEGADPNEPGQVKVVLDKEGFALYFSRSVMPYPRAPYSKPILNHMGMYGYRADFLQQYVKLKQTPLEKAEVLEQLRALENGVRIKVGVGNYNRVEVNERHEFEEAQRVMALLLAKKRKKQ